MKKDIIFLFSLVCLYVCMVVTPCAYGSDSECIESPFIAQRSVLRILRYFEHCDFHALLAEAVDIAHMHDIVIPQRVVHCLTLLDSGKRELDCIDLLETLSFVLEHALVLRSLGYEHMQRLSIELTQPATECA